MTSNPPQTLNGTTNHSFPATKAQLYGATRPNYVPQPKPTHRRRKNCCCACFLWTSLLVIILIFFAAIAGTVFYFLYHPHRPSFSLTTLHISQFNITTSKDSSSHLNSKLDLTISTRNPNRKLTFIYDPITVSVSSNGVDVGDGSIPAFVHGTQNTTVLRASVSSTARELDLASATSLGSDLKKKSGLPLKIQLETKVKVKIGGLKTKKIGIKVSCSGIQAVVAKGKTPSSSSLSSSNAKCKVKLRIKIWKWTL